MASRVATSARIRAGCACIGQKLRRFEDDSGQGDIHLRISIMTVVLSTAVLLVGAVSGLVAALRASKRDPVDALRRE